MNEIIKKNKIKIGQYCFIVLRARNLTLKMSKYDKNYISLSASVLKKLLRLLGKNWIVFKSINCFFVLYINTSYSSISSYNIIMRVTLLSNKSMNFRI